MHVSRPNAGFMALHNHRLSWRGTVLQDKDFQAAAALAFELGHAGRLLSVVDSALSQGAELAQAILGSLVR